MNKIELRAALAQMLNVLESDDEIPVDAPLAQALLAEVFPGHAPSTVTTEQIAAYASGAMDESDRAAFEAEMVASTDTFEEVMNALDLLHRVEAYGEVELPPEVENIVASSAEPITLLTRAGMLAFLREGQPLLATQLRQLFADAALREKFESLKRSLAARLASGALFEMPRMAAAASGDQLLRRRFPGATIEFAQSRGSNRLLAILTLDRPERNTPPRIMLLQGEAEIVRVALRSPDMQGRIQLELDRERDALTIKLLNDRDATATFFGPATSSESTPS
jgi:hypothetical protein